MCRAPRWSRADSALDQHIQRPTPSYEERAVTGPRDQVALLITSHSGPQLGSAAGSAPPQLPQAQRCAGDRRQKSGDHSGHGLRQDDRRQQQRQHHSTITATAETSASHLMPGLPCGGCRTQRPPGHRRNGSSSISTLMPVHRIAQGSGILPDRRFGTGTAFR